MMQSLSLTPGRLAALALLLFGLWIEPGTALTFAFMIGMAYAIIKKHAPKVEAKLPASGKASTNVAAAVQRQSPHQAQVASLDRRAPVRAVTAGSGQAHTTVGNASDALFGQVDCPPHRASVAGLGNDRLSVAKPAPARPLHAPRLPRSLDAVGAASAGPVKGASMFVAAKPDMSRTSPPSQQPARRGWSLSFWGPIRRLLDKVHPQAYPYLRACIAFLLTMGAFQVLKAGGRPSNGMFDALTILFPTAWLAVMTLPICAPVLGAITRFVRGFGMRRGFADAAVGLIFSTAFSLPLLLSPDKLGVGALVSALGFSVAGVMAGFEFWRAEGFPEARRSTGQLVGNLKDGFMKGLSR